MQGLGIQLNFILSHLGVILSSGSSAWRLAIKVQGLQCTCLQSRRSTPDVNTSGSLLLRLITVGYLNE